MDWYKHSEKSSKYFLNLEKRSKGKSHINLDETTDPGEILSYLRIFYLTLYKRQSNKTVNESVDYLENLNLRRLNDAEKAVC